MRILSSTLLGIKQQFQSAPIEAGGIIGSKADVICAFYFDNENYNFDCYIPNVKKLNAKIAEWANSGIQFGGVVHSHHNDCRLFSEADKNYALEVQKCVGNLTLYFPIVTICKQEVVLTPYIIEGKELKKDCITIIDD